MGGTFNTMGENQPKGSAPPNLFGKLNKEALAKEYGIQYTSLNPDTGRNSEPSMNSISTSQIR